MPEPDAGAQAPAIPFFVPRFYVLILNTIGMKLSHRLNRERAYTDHIRTFYTRSETQNVETYGDAYAEVRRLVVEKAAPQPGDRVLDAATGGGYQAAAFARHGELQVVGMDYVHDRARLASEQHALPVTWGVSDISRLPYKNNAFDIITVSLALHDLPHDIRTRALAELRRVAHKRVVILEPRAPRIPVWRHIFALLCELIDESLHIWGFVLHDFEACLHEAGLKIVSAERAFHGVLVCYVLEPV